jgi:hypothetical protein
MQFTPESTNIRQAHNFRHIYDSPGKFTEKLRDMAPIS